MRSKLKYLIGVSLKRKIMTKWFVVANALLAIVLVGFLNIDTIITAFGGDFNEKTKIYVLDETNRAYDLFSEQVDLNGISFTDNEENPFEVVLTDKNEEDATLELKENKGSMLILFRHDHQNTLSAKLISEGYIDTLDYQAIMNSINNTKVALSIMDSSISMEEIQEIYAPVEIERIILDETKKTEDESMSMIMSTVFPMFILPFFMLTLFLVQMIGAEVNDEKTTRGMEIIISNVSPKTHFFAKVIAGNVFVISQGILLLLYGGLGFLVRSFISKGTGIVDGLGGQIGNVVSSLTSSGIWDKLLYIIPLALVLMLLTFVAYSLVAGILASVTTNTEDFQQLQTPIIIVSLAGYMLATMAGAFNGAIFIKIFSFVPFISAILAPSLLMLGQIGVIEVIISILIMIVTNYLLIKYGLKIYKVGILNYSSRGLWKKMFKALKD